MKILLSAAAAALAITGIQIADKQTEVVPEETMPEASYSEEASWVSTLENTKLPCIFSIESAKNKRSKDDCK
jgi:hypothetical protein